MTTVYILTNQAMPGLVKIGRTEATVEDRMKQLDQTGVPLPFECFSAHRVADPNAVESAFHIAFGDHRVRDKREFFRVSPDKPNALLKLMSLANVTPGQDVIEDEDDARALQESRQRRSRFRFSLVGIVPGTELVSVFDEAERCVVHDDKKVLFRGEIDSLSNSALTIAHETGRDWPSVAGPTYWKYDDKTLAEWREDAGDGPE